jgi:ADP-heptose:LPS heptosyltransferase
LAKNIQKHPAKILVIHTGGIGDLILALPALRIFRGTNPNASLEAMGHPERLALIAYDLKIKAVHSMDQAGMSYFYLEKEALPIKLAALFSSFDMILVFGKERGKILVENLIRVGVKKVLPIPTFPEKNSPAHVADFLVRSLRRFKIEGKSPFLPLALSEKALAAGETLWSHWGFGKKDWVLGIHPGSGSPGKNWSTKKFAKVGDWAGQYGKLLLISGPARDHVEEVKKEMRSTRPVVAENLSLPHLAAVLKNCSAYLGNDSGITHLAAAVGIPVLALFGPTDPAVWGPRGIGVRVLRAKKSCSPCLPEIRSGCPQNCLNEIKPERVIEMLTLFRQ